MIKKQLKVVNDLGFHGRVCFYLKETLKPFEDSCKIVFLNEKAEEFDPYSMLEILNMGLTKGREVTIVVEGENENEVVEMIEHYFKNAN